MVLDEDGNIDNNTIINCCNIPDITSYELDQITKFTNMEEPFTNKNIDNNNMYESFTNIIEGASNIDATNNCSVIKEELLTKLAIPEEQLILDCKLNKQGTKHLIKAHIISTQANPISEEHHEKLFAGIKIDSLGIEVKSKLGIKEEGGGKAVIVIILIILIIAAIIGGIYMVKEK